MKRPAQRTDKYKLHVRTHHARPTMLLLYMPFHEYVCYNLTCGLLICIGRVSSGKRTLLGMQSNGRVGVVSSSSILAGSSSSISPKYCKCILCVRGYQIYKHIKCYKNAQNQVANLTLNTYKAISTRIKHYNSIYPLTAISTAVTNKN